MHRSSLPRSTGRAPSFEAHRLDQIATNLNIQPVVVRAGVAQFPGPIRRPAFLISLAVQTPEPQIASLNAITDTPVSATITSQGPPVPGLLGNVATLTRQSMPTNANQANVQPVYEVYASVQGRDLGSIAAARSARSLTICVPS